MRKRLNKLNNKVVSKIKGDVIRDCESRYSLDQIKELQKSTDFQGEKDAIFKKEPGRKYIENHWAVIWTRRIAIGFLVLFFVCFFVLLFVNRDDDAGVMFGVFIGAGFLYFSLRPFYTEFQKYVYDFYFEPYKDLIETYIVIQDKAYAEYERLLFEHIELKKNYDALIENKLSQSSIAVSTEDEVDSAESKGNSKLPKDN